MLRNTVCSLAVLMGILDISFGNELCQNDRWNIIKGNWNENIDCSLTNTNSDAGNIVWFGSTDGFSPDLCNYDFEHFIIEVEYEINSNTGDAGILFRATNVQTTNDGGQQYYIGLYPESNRVIFGRMMDGWNPIASASYTIDAHIRYKLKVVGIGSSYKVFIDNNLVLDNIVANEYLSGSIGLRTYFAPAKYYSINIKNANALCFSCDDWNIIKGIWYEDKDCSLSNVDSASGNIVWFGSENGKTSNYKYDFKSFIIETEYEINSNFGDSGILFRAKNVKEMNDGGQQYYIGLYPATNQVVFGRMDDSWNPLASASYIINPNTIYKLKVVADVSTYKIYIDDNLLITNTNSDYLFGSIGLRTFNAPSKYHSFFITSIN